MRNANVITIYMHRGGIEPKERTELNSVLPAHPHDLQTKMRVNLRVLTTGRDKIYDGIQLNRELNDPESGHRDLKKSALKAGFLLSRYSVFLNYIQLLYKFYPVISTYPARRPQFIGEINH